MGLDGEVHVAGREVEARVALGDHGERLGLAQDLPHADAVLKRGHLSLEAVQEGGHAVGLRLARCVGLLFSLLPLNRQQLAREARLLDLALGPEEAHLVLALRLREAVHAARRLLDDLLEDARSAAVRAFVVCDLEGVDLEATFSVKCQVLLHHVVRDLVQGLHEGLERHTGHALDELRAYMHGHVTARVARLVPHFGQVHKLPEDHAIKH
mmetsp:Transcript_75022/g.212188  ORF Transcript_75022/g.212188 Transcript_75022/m.212188 type:complete len:211 (-) Transcript_75022:1355-1987(-)